MIKTIARIFRENAWTWKVDGKDITPDEKMLTETIDKLAETLYASEQGTQLSLGRLILVRKDHPTLLDVYMLVGTINKESND